MRGVRAGRTHLGQIMGRFSDGPRAWFLTEAALLAGMIDFWQMNSARSWMNS